MAPILLSKKERKKTSAKPQGKGAYCLHSFPSLQERMKYFCEEKYFSISGGQKQFWEERSSSQMDAQWAICFWWCLFVWAEQRGEEKFCNKEFVGRRERADWPTSQHSWSCQIFDKLPLEETFENAQWRKVPRMLFLLLFRWHQNTAVSEQIWKKPGKKMRLERQQCLSKW